MPKPEKPLLGAAMLGLWVMVLNFAQAATHAIGMSVDAHRSIGLSTRLQVTGIGGSLQILRKGNGPHGFLFEVQDLIEWSPSGLSHLPGGRLGWYRQGRTLSADTQFYSLVGLGAYANEVLPILPIIWGESGTQGRLGGCNTCYEGESSVREFRECKNGAKRQFISLRQIYAATLQG